MVHLHTNSPVPLAGTIQLFVPLREGVLGFCV